MVEVSKIKVQAVWSKKTDMRIQTELEKTQHKTRSANCVETYNLAI